MDAEMEHHWPFFNNQVLNYIAWKPEWKTHHEENYPSLKGDALRRVLVEPCLQPADKEHVHYRSSLDQYLVWAYLRQDTFLHNFMKPFHAIRRMGRNNYQSFEEFLDLMIRTFDIPEEARMLPILLHQNNLRPMHKNGLIGSRSGGGHMQRMSTSWSSQRNSGSISGPPIKSSLRWPARRQ
jgi:hypothetical protein